MPHKGRSIHIQWLDHRIERNTKKTREVLALDDGQAGDRMYLVQAPKVMKKTRWGFFISSRNYIFCTIKVNRFLAKYVLLVVFFAPLDQAWPTADSSLNWPTIGGCVVRLNAAQVMRKCCGFASLCALDANTWRSGLFATQVVGCSRSQLLLVSLLVSLFCLHRCFERKKPRPS